MMDVVGPAAETLVLMDAPAAGEPAVFVRTDIQVPPAVEPTVRLVNRCYH